MAWSKSFEGIGMRDFKYMKNNGITFPYIIINIKYMRGVREIGGGKGWVL